MNPNKFFILVCFAALFLFSDLASANSKAVRADILPCTFEVSITSIAITSGGVLLIVASDGQCGFTDLDPTLFGITWEIDGNSPLAGGSNLIVAPFSTNIEVTVKNIATGETAKAWFQTPADQSAQLINGFSLPGFSSQDTTPEN